MLTATDETAKSPDAALATKIKSLPLIQEMEGGNDLGKIGIYGSSFYPVTNVHLWTASTVAHRCKLDRVIFLPSSNQRPDKQMHISDEHRWNLIRLAIHGNKKFVADDYEMNQHAFEIVKIFRKNKS